MLLDDACSTLANDLSCYCVDDVNTLSPNAVSQSSCRQRVRRPGCV